MMMPIDQEQKVYEDLAKQDEKVQKFLDGLTIRKVIFVKNKLINLIAN